MMCNHFGVQLIMLYYIIIRGNNEKINKNLMILLHKFYGLNGSE